MEKPKKRIFVVPYSHIDWGWGYYLGPSIYHINQANVRIIRKALELLDKYPEYRWCGIDKFYTISTFWLLNPQLHEKIRKYVREGKIDIACGMVSTPHLLGISSTHCSGESLIRNIIYGRELFERILGFKFKNIVLQLNDVTGLFSQLPQIVFKCGFKFLKFERPFKLYNKLGIPLDFIWEAPDGSRVLCNRVPYGSGWKPYLYKSFEEAKEEFMKAIQPLLKFSKIDYLLFYQGGDWDPPCEELIHFVREWNQRNEEVKLKISTPTEYFETISKENYKFPVIKGSLDNVSWAALYGVAGDKHRKLQMKIVNLLLTCEKFLTIASFMGLKYPEEILKQLWIIETLWEDHNTIAYLYPSDLQAFHEDIKYVESKASELLNLALNTIASNIELTKMRGIPIVVFNQLNWDREDVVKVRIRFNTFSGFRYFKLLDVSGNEVPYQILNEKYNLDGSLREVEILFIAKVPALGYSTYYIVPSDSKPNYEGFLKCYKAEEVGTTSYIIENEYFRVRVANGHITSIIDKRCGVDVLQIVRHEKLRGMGLYMGNSIICEKVEYGFVGLTGKVEKVLYSSSTFSPDKIELIENGPIRAILRVHFSYLEDPMSFDIILYRNIPRIEFRIKIIARHSGRRFRAVFPLNVRNGRLFVDKPFIVEEIDITKESYECDERSFGKMGKVFGAYSWVDLCNEHYGVALISRQNAGFMLENKHIISCILLSTVTPNSLLRFRNSPEMLGLGEHTFEYALYPHVGDVYQGKVYHKALEYLNPLIALANVEGHGNLPLSYSFLKVEPTNLILSALIRKDKEVIFRIYEIEGKNTSCKIQFFKSVTKLYETNFIGEIITEDEKKVLTFKAHEIKEIHGEIS